VANTKGYVSRSLRQSSANGSGKIEATATTTARRGPDQKTRRTERELESLRPLGQRYVRAHFGPGLSPQDAEDVVSEVIARLFDRFERGEEASNLNALFFTSVHNASVDLTRQRRRRPEVALEAAADEESGGPEPLDRALASETGALVRDVLARIRPRYREALALRFGVGLNTVEIAKHKGISVTAAKKLVNRAAHETESELARLREGAHCPDARELIRAGLFSQAAVQGPAAPRIDQLNRHLAHCGACKSFLSELKGLHELAGTALLTGSGAAAVAHRSGFVEQISSLASSLGDGAHAASDRVRLAALKAGQHLTAADGASAGGITGTAKQITAICATGATITGCLAAGVVGPGVGGGGHHPAPQDTSTVADTPTTATAPSVPPPAADPTTTSPNPTQTTTTTPVQQTNREFGLAQTASSSSSSASRDFAAPSSGSSGGGSGGGGGSSSRENFGL
jgi:RNA polymerase sigma factor (sigma-70 family)